LRVCVDMKVIFLDIDGVLNSTATPNPRKFPYVVDEKLLKHLLFILEQTGAQVVLSSTWRYDPVGRLAAKHAGIPFVDVTPDMPGAPRCGEIEAWLDAHPDVERHVVIDDDNDCLDELPLFQPFASEGLTAEIARGVIDYLNGKTETDIRRGSLVRAAQRLRAAVSGHQG
jgi:Swiss Army Knife RNA repair-like protein